MRNKSQWSQQSTHNNATTERPQLSCSNSWRGHNHRKKINHRKLSTLHLWMRVRAYSTSDWFTNCWLTPGGLQPTSKSVSQHRAGSYPDRQSQPPPAKKDPNWKWIVREAMLSKLCPKHSLTNVHIFITYIYDTRPVNTYICTYNHNTCIPIHNIPYQTLQPIVTTCMIRSGMAHAFEPYPSDHPPPLLPCHLSLPPQPWAWQNLALGALLSRLQPLFSCLPLEETFKKKNPMNEIGEVDY